MEYVYGNLMNHDENEQEISIKNFPPLPPLRPEAEAMLRRRKKNHRKQSF